MSPLSHKVGSSREADRRQGEGDPVAARHPPPPDSRSVEEGDSNLLSSIRRRVTRHTKAQREGQPSFGRYLAQVGVLGWTIVLPTLLGVFAGRWVDHRLGTGIFWTGPLLMAGLAIGCWSAWRWVHRP